MSLNDQLKKLSIFAGGFFALLAGLVGALPFIANLHSSFPDPCNPGFPQILPILTSLVGIAAVGGGFLTAFASSAPRRKMGVVRIFVAVGLTIAYLHNCEAIQAVPLRALWYLVIYGVAASGLLEMTLFAFKLPDGVELQAPLWIRIRRDFRRWRRDRQESRQAELRKRIRIKEKLLEKAVERYEKLEKEERQRQARRARLRKRLLILLMAAAILCIALLLWGR